MSIAMTGLQWAWKSCAVSNSIWVHNGQLADFSSTLSEPRDAERLGDLWRPGAAPDRTPGA